MNVNIGLEDATEAIIEDVQLFDYALFPEDIAELSAIEPSAIPLLEEPVLSVSKEAGVGSPGSAGILPAEEQSLTPLSDDGPVLLGDGDGPVITTITYYYINGQRVAQAKDGVFTWIHADHLSSATRITDVSGLEVRRLAYAAFGEEAENQGRGDDPKYTYTGKEHDATGLYYYGARYYDPALSRFITADTVYDAGPQGLNRYSYALNNPIIYRDPTGHYISGPRDDDEPTGYGCVTGSQDQFADDTATIHDGSDGSSNQPLSNAEGFLVADPRIYASPYPNYPSPDPMGYVKGKLQDLERQLYDEGGSVQQRIVDTQQGMMDELVSQGTSVLDIADPTGGLISGWQSRLVSGASERVMNFSYDTASGGLRPRENSLWYKTGKYGTAVIIFLATIKAGGGASKTSKSDDILVLGRGTPDELQGIADKVGGRVINISNADMVNDPRALFKHIHSEMRKADKIIQVMDDIPVNQVTGRGTGQWARAEKIFIDQNPAKFEKKVRRIYRSALE